jgi:nucleotide-binding universal stress UspA family protein
MSKIIVSFDGTNNEDDAIALGKLFAAAGAEIVLAYVHHQPATTSPGGELGDGEARDLLARGVKLFGSDVETQVVVDRSTPAGLAVLAERLGADAIVFCSDSHTARGHIGVGNSAERLLENGRVAIAVAPAGLARRADARLERIATTGAQDDGSVAETAGSLAGSLGGTLTDVTDSNADLLVLGSRPETEPGRVSVSAAVQNLIDLSTAPVLVLPRGVSIAFGTPAVIGA